MLFIFSFQKLALVFVLLAVEAVLANVLLAALADKSKELSFNNACCHFIAKSSLF